VTAFLISLFWCVFQLSFLPALVYLPFPVTQNSIRLGTGALLVDVLDDFDIRDGNQPFIDHLIERGNELLNFVVVSTIATMMGASEENESRCARWMRVLAPYPWMPL
jgi:hypothetical protein